MKTRTISYATVAVSLAGVAALLILSRRAVADPSPDGLWTLTEIVEDDDSTRPPPTAALVTYTVDFGAHTVVNDWCLPGNATPYETTSFSYVVTETGTWYVANAGPGGRSIEFSVECTESTLTLTRVAYGGPDGVLAPSPVYQSGPAPSSPGTIPPPKKFILSR